MQLNRPSRQGISYKGLAAQPWNDFCQLTLQQKINCHSEVSSTSARSELDSIVSQIENPKRSRRVFIIGIVVPDPNFHGEVSNLNEAGGSADPLWWPEMSGPFGM